jgi:hypothetical protein
MQSHGGSTQSGTNNTLQQTISYINSNQEAAIIELFNTDPDGMFAIEIVENAYFYSGQADKQNIQKLLERLSYQYIADKTRLADWDKAAAFYLGVGRYYASTKDYFGAQIAFEKAWFFKQKLTKQQGDSYDATKDVDILKEWLSYATKLAECRISSKDLADWAIICEEIYDQQMLTAIAIKIADRTRQSQDSDVIEKYHGNLADAYLVLAEHFYKIAALMDETKELIPLINARLRYCQACIQQAISFYKLAKSAEDKILSAEFLHELITQKCQSLKNRSDLDKQIFNEDQRYIVGLMAENRNTDVAKIRNVINEIDINFPLDFYNLVPDSELYDLREVRMANWIVCSGSLDLVKLFCEELQAKIWLFPTYEKKGLIEDLGNFVASEVREYLFTPNEGFYQTSEQKECVEFFQDALAGRLDKVQEKLNSNSKLILQYPQIQDGDDASMEKYVIHMAFHQSQLHVVWYLEEFIAYYILDNTDHIALEKLYHCLMDCYMQYGWDDRRSDLVENVKKTLLNLLNSNIREFSTKAKNQLTEADKKEYNLNKYAVLLVTYAEGKKLESDGDQCRTDDRLSYYAWANTKYQEVIDNMFDPDFHEINGYENVCADLWARKEIIDGILDQDAISSDDEDDEYKSDEFKSDNDSDFKDDKIEIVPLKRDSKSTNFSTQTWASNFQPAPSTAISSTSALSTDAMEQRSQPSSTSKRKRSDSPISVISTDVKEQQREPSPTLKQYKRS